MTNVTLAQLTHASINSGTPVRLLCTNINISGKTNISVEPDANGNNQVEVHKQSYENLIYNISGLHFTGAANTLTYTDLLTLYRAKYGGSYAPAYLTATYGDGTVLKGVDGSTTSIKVLLESFNFPISMTDSKNGYMPVANVVLRETL